MQSGPRCWEGLSGAAVRVGGDVVAVVCTAPPPGAGGPLRATPVGQFVGSRWYPEALGCGEAHKALQDEADALMEELRALLAPWALLRGALRSALGAAAEEADALAQALVGGRAEAVVSALHTAGTRLERDQAPDGEREALWRVLERASPDQPEPMLELSCRTQTVAEIVLAGVDGRCCTFVPLEGSQVLTGTGFLCWPAASSAPMRQTPERLREAIVQKLASELGVGDGAEPGAWVVEQLAEVTQTQLVGGVLGILGEIEARLAFALRSQDSSPRRRHLLVIDDELGGPEAGLVAWQVVQAAFGERLPSLRFACLTGSAAQRGPETSIAAPIEALYKARNPR